MGPGVEGLELGQRVGVGWTVASCLHCDQFDGASQRHSLFDLVLQESQWLDCERESPVERGRSWNCPEVFDPECL